MRGWAKLATAALVTAGATAAIAISGATDAVAIASTCVTPTVSHTGAANVTVTAHTSTPNFTYVDCDLSISTGTTISFAMVGILPHTLTSDSGDAESFNLTTNGASFRFDHAGTFPFHCSYHGDLYGMRGVVRVVGANVNSAPTASFTGPTSAAPGKQVTFDARASKDPDAGDTLSYHWDLDGSAANRFERTTTTPSVTTSYATTGRRTVRLQVIDNHGAASNIASHSITVTTGGAYPGVGLAHRTIHVASNRKVALRLRCPAGTTGRCSGKVHIVKPAGASKSFSIAAGHSKTVSLLLSKAVFKRLQRHHKLSATLSITGHDGAGHKSHQARQKLTLEPKAKPTTPMVLY